ncbi:MAG: Hpt domain-containing protein [Bdellovibrionota bacterium]
MDVPEEMLNRYVERRRRDLEECVRHLRDGKLNFIEKVGHQLKGNADTFGYPELSEIGKELEVAAQKGSHDQILFVIDKFRDWVDVHVS